MRAPADPREPPGPLAALSNRGKLRYRLSIRRRSDHITRKVRYLSHSLGLNDTIIGAGGSGGGIIQLSIDGTTIAGNVNIWMYILLRRGPLTK